MFKSRGIVPRQPSVTGRLTLPERHFKSCLLPSDCHSGRVFSLERRVAKKPLPKQGHQPGTCGQRQASGQNERWQTCQRINTDLPIIGHNRRWRRQMALVARNSILLEKPFQPAQLIGAVSQLRNDATPSNIKTAAVGGLLSRTRPDGLGASGRRRGEWRLAWQKKAPNDAGAFRIAEPWTQISTSWRPGHPS